MEGYFHSRPIEVDEQALFIQVLEFSQSFGTSAYSVYIQYTSLQVLRLIVAAMEPTREELKELKEELKLH